MACLGLLAMVLLLILGRRRHIIYTSFDDIGHPGNPFDGT